MLAHIHPHPPWFACESRPLFNGFVAPGSVSRTIQNPPRAQSPFARRRRYPRRRDLSRITSERITPLSSLLRAARPYPSRCLRPSLYNGSLQVVASPCWEMVLPDVISAIPA